MPFSFEHPEGFWLNLYAAAYGRVCEEIWRCHTHQAEYDQVERQKAFPDAKKRIADYKKQVKRLHKELMANLGPAMANIPVNNASDQREFAKLFWKIHRLAFRCLLKSEAEQHDVDAKIANDLSTTLIDYSAIVHTYAEEQIFND